MTDLEICREFGIPIIPIERKYWLVRTKSGVYFNDFYLNDYIAIGWDEIDDISLMAESKRESLVEKIKSEYDKSKNTDEEDSEVKKTGNYGLIATQLIRFATEIKKGDIVIIPSQKSNNVAFGEVLDDEIYKESIDLEDIEDTQCPFIKRRKVRWIKRQNKESVDIYLYKLLNSHHTITDACEYSNIIERTLNSIYVKDNIAHFTMRVGQENNIKLKELSRLINNNISIIDEFNNFTNSNLDVDDVAIKINLHSPGPVEIEGVINGVLVISMITFAICGGAFKFTRKNGKKDTETGLEMQSDGFMEKLIKFMDHFNNNKLENERLKAQLEESKRDLRISVPQDVIAETVVDILEEEIINEVDTNNEVESNDETSK